jgi:Putative addiction module component
MPSRQRAVMTLSVPPLMAAEYRQLAKEKGESASELFREMFTFYKQNKLKKELYELQEYGARRVREVGVSADGDEHPDLVLLSQEGYERMLDKLNQRQPDDEDIEALWVREAETRYDEITAGKVECRPLGEAIADARRALK